MTHETQDLRQWQGTKTETKTSEPGIWKRSQIEKLQYKYIYIYIVYMYVSACYICYAYIYIYIYYSIHVMLCVHFLIPAPGDQQKADEGHLLIWDGHGDFHLVNDPG